MSSLRSSVFCSIFPSPDQQLTASLKPAAHNTGGSLPDLTNIQFPPPLPTPLDSDDAVAASFSSSNSTQTLANTQGNTTDSHLLTFNKLENFRFSYFRFFMCRIVTTFCFDIKHSPVPISLRLCVCFYKINSFLVLFSVCWVGVNTSQPTVTMEMQPEQEDMVPLILNAGDSHQHQNLQLSPTSPPLTLSQVQPGLWPDLSQWIEFIWDNS